MLLESNTPAIRGVACMSSGMKAQEVSSLLVVICMAINLNPPLQAGQCSSSRFHEHKPAENPGCPIKHLIVNQNLVSFLLQALAERTEKVCEMAAVMKVSIESKVVNLGLML